MLMQTCLTPRLLSSIHPALALPFLALPQVQAEQAAVVARHGATLTPAAYADMPYTQAVVKETLRSAQIIAYVPRVATRELQVPGGPTLPAGCPFIMALSAISASDPALQKDWRCGAVQAREVCAGMSHTATYGTIVNIGGHEGTSHQPHKYCSCLHILAVRVDRPHLKGSTCNFGGGTTANGPATHWLKPVEPMT